MIIGVKNLANGVKRYATALRLILGEGFNIAKWPVFLTVLFDILTLISQTGALGILAQIPRYISRNTTEVSNSINSSSTNTAIEPEENGVTQEAIISFPSFSLAKIENYFFSLSADIFIPIVIGCSFLALLFTTLSRYFATYYARKSARSYHEKIVSKCYKTAIRSDFWRFGSQQAKIKEIQFNLVQYSIHVSQAFERLIRLAPVLIAIPIGAYVAFAVQPIATGILFLLAFVLVPGTLLVGRHIHKNASSFFELEAVDFNATLSQNLYRNFYQSLPPQVSSKDSNLELMDRPFKSFLKSYDMLQLSSAQMMVVTGIVRAIIFFAVLIILFLIVYQNNNFAAVAVYGTVLYIILNTVQSAISVIANLNVYAPQVLKYLKLSDRIFAEPIQTNYTSEAVLSLNKTNGLLVDVISSEPFSRTGYHGYLPYLTNHFEVSLKKEEIFIFPTTSAVEIDGYSYKDLSEAFEKKTGLELDAFIKIWDNGNQIDSWLDREGDRRSKPLGSLMHLQTRLRFAFMMCLACIHDAKIIEIPSQHFPKLAGDDFTILNILAEKFVLIRRTKPDQSISDHCHLVFLVNFNEVFIVPPKEFTPQMLEKLKSSDEKSGVIGDSISVMM